MHGWDSIHQKFRDINNRINYEDLGYALRNTNVTVLQRLVAQLTIDECCIERDIKTYTTDQLILTDSIVKTREAYRNLLAHNQKTQKEMPCLQKNIAALEKKQREFNKELSKMQCEMAARIAAEKRAMQKSCLTFKCEQNAKTGQINDLFCEILVLRAGQLAQCAFLEDLVERKPAVLAKFKEQLKCKRKRLMQMQVQQEECGVKDMCDQQRQNAARHLEKKLNTREEKVCRQELNRIRGHRCALDGLVRSFTEEIYKATELPVEVIQMRRFFQSLHRSNRSDVAIKVLETDSSVEDWEKAVEIQKMQSDLAYYYQHNFNSQSELIGLLLDQQLLAVAIDADATPTCQIDYAEVIECHPSDQHRISRQGGQEMEGARCSPEENEYAGDHGFISTSDKQESRSKSNSRNCSLTRKSSAGFMMPDINDDAVKVNEKSARIKLDCRLNRRQTGEKTVVTCRVVPAVNTSSDAPYAKIASFRQSELDCLPVLQAGSPIPVPTPPVKCRAVRVSPAAGLPYLTCQCQTVGTEAERWMTCHCVVNPFREHPVTTAYTDLPKNLFPDDGCAYTPDMDDDPNGAPSTRSSSQRSSRSKPRPKSCVTYCECCDEPHDDTRTPCVCQTRDKRKSVVEDTVRQRRKFPANLQREEFRDATCARAAAGRTPVKPHLPVELYDPSQPGPIYWKESDALPALNACPPPTRRGLLLDMLTPGGGCGEVTMASDHEADSDLEEDGYSMLSPVSMRSSYQQPLPGCSPDRNSYNASRDTAGGAADQYPANPMAWRELAREMLTTSVQIKYVQDTLPGTVCEIKSRQN